MNFTQGRSESIAKYLSSLAILAVVAALLSAPGTTFANESARRANLIALGRALFFDKSLSADGTVACAS
ncbi:MAG TPA: cytochrome c peroxidase, partial [Tahibacter sp.]|nr:cytochrome c peroxidase [Tahibacter sp.]